MRRLLAWLACVASCGYPSLDKLGGGPPSDGGGDAGMDYEDAFVGAQVRVSFTSYGQHVAEGDSGDHIAYVDLFLDAPAGLPAKVPFIVSPYITTAIEGEDYTILTPSPLIFPAGTTSQTIQVAIHGDTMLDGTKRIAFNISGQLPGTGAEVHTLTIDSDECYGSGAFRLCPTEPAGSSLVLSGTIEAGGNFPPCGETPPQWIAGGQFDACIVMASDITISSLHAVGARPLVIFAYNSITVNTLLDVGSHAGEVSSGGAGNSMMTPPYTRCLFNTAPDPGAGGAGGSFMTVGGSGGAHDTPTAAGGTPFAAVSAPMILRGGCRGQDTNLVDSYIDYRGQGGGGVYLIAGGSITLASGSVINASGAGGYGGRAGGGGAGGGSGGMIALWAPTIAATNATLLANGGGGGEGAPTSAGNGTDGQDPVISTPLTVALGGTGTVGGDGGTGAAASTAAVDGAAASGATSAGGGGGGAGYIVSNQALSGAIVSPPAATF